MDFNYLSMTNLLIPKVKHKKLLLSKNGKDITNKKCKANDDKRIALNSMYVLSIMIH